MGHYTKGNTKANELVKRLLIGFFLGLVLGMHSHTVLDYSRQKSENVNLLSVASVSNNDLKPPGNYYHHYIIFTVQRVLTTLMEPWLSFADSQSVHHAIILSIWVRTTGSP
jgi:hypothetical protein